MDKNFLALFGFNRINFYGWIVAGVLVFGLVITGLLRILSNTPNWLNEPFFVLQLLLVVLLAAIFGMMLQFYCAVVVEKLAKTPLEDEEE